MPLKQRLMDATDDDSSSLEPMVPSARLKLLSPKKLGHVSEDDVSMKILH